MDLVEQKRTLRRSMRAQLSVIESSECAIKSKKAVSHLDVWLNEHPRLINIAIFSALPSELDLKFSQSLKPRLAWHYPIVRGDELEFHRVSCPDDLNEGYMGIQEPRPMVLHPPVIPDSLDLVICPGLAFTLSGSRLGRGGGFYDRFLKKTTPRTIRMGACFSQQVRTSLPRESHDISVQYLLSDNGVCEVTHGAQSIHA